MGEPLAFILCSMLSTSLFSKSFSPIVLSSIPFNFPDISFTLLFWEDNSHHLLPRALYSGNKVRCCYHSHKPSFLNKTCTILYLAHCISFFSYLKRDLVHESAAWSEKVVDPKIIIKDGPKNYLEGKNMLHRKCGST